jgi:hypothetical protein
VPSKADLRKAARTLRRITAETEGLPDDMRADRTLQDRLELAADVLDATAAGESAPDMDHG